MNFDVMMMTDLKESEKGLSLIWSLTFSKKCDKNERGKGEENVLKLDCFLFKRDEVKKARRNQHRSSFGRDEKLS